jgi:mannose-6-phosphate isomerase-like protein (cupin superfamily)
MARCGDVYENKITSGRGVVLRGDEDSDERTALVHLIVQPHGTVAGEHIHPRIREAFRVISGRLGTRVGGVERTLTVGEEAVAVPGTWRDLRNRGEEEAHVLPGLSPLDPWSGPDDRDDVRAGECGQDHRKRDAQSAAARDDRPGIPGRRPVRQAAACGAAGDVRAARPSRPGVRLSGGLSRVPPPPRTHHLRSKCARARWAGTTGPG